MFGKLQQAQDLHVGPEAIICGLGADSSYKYLGLLELNDTLHRRVKDTAIAEFSRRVRSLIAQSLCARDLVRALNTFAVPVLLYGFGVIHWLLAEVRQLDTLFRKLLKQAGLHPPRSSTDWLYIGRLLGGRGLLQLEQLHSQCLVSLAKYMIQSQDPSVQLLRSYHQHAVPPSKSIIVRAQKYLESISSWEEYGFRIPKNTIKAIQSRCRQERICAKPLHGQFWRRVNAIPSISLSLSFKWLSSPRLKPSTEATILAAQDQSLRTRNYEYAVMKARSRQQANCRLCHQSLETIDHVISACSALAAKKYVERHSSIVRCLHWALSRHHGVPDVGADHHRHTLKPVVYGRGVRILWEFTVPTARPLGANRPDLVLVDDVARCVKLIDVSVPLDCNIVQKAAEKVIKYAPLCIEIRQLWHMEAVVVPIVLGALGCATADVEVRLAELGCGYFTICQELAVWGFCHILRLVLGV